MFDRMTDRRAAIQICGGHPLKHRPPSSLWLPFLIEMRSVHSVSAELPQFHSSSFLSFHFAIGLTESWAGIVATAREPDASKVLLKFLISPDAAAAIKAAVRE